MGFVREVTLNKTFALCSCVNSSTERRGERVELFGATGGATILNLIASADRTTCGRRLPVAMVLITRWRKCIQAVRIGPHVIHTFIPLWKSAQMFNMLEKMSQKPENQYGLNRVTTSAIRTEKRAISVESKHIYQCVDLVWDFSHGLDILLKEIKLFSTIKIFHQALIIHALYYVYLPGYFLDFKTAPGHLEYKRLVSVWQCQLGFVDDAVLIPNCSTKQHSIMIVQSIPRQDANRKTCLFALSLYLKQKWKCALCLLIQSVEVPCRMASHNKRFIIDKAASICS